VFELTAAGLKRDAEVSAAESIAPQTARRLDRAIIAVLLVALGYLAFDKFVLGPRREAALVVQATATSNAARPELAGAPAAVPEKSIAVLPLDNEGGDADERYFSDGLSENLITALSQFGGLKVISRNSAFQFRDTKDSSRIIGEKLGVAHLLEGSVRRLGDTVRVNAVLVLAVDGRAVWSERYDRPYTDLFALQDEIAAAVATALKAKLIDTANVRVQDDRPPGGDLVAYNAYLQGTFQANLATPESHAKAIASFKQAIERDPRYAVAWAGLGYVQSIDAGLYGAGDAMRAGMANARRSIDQALALDPDSAFAHGVDATVLMNAELRYVDAERAALRAVALSPTSFNLFSLGLARHGLGDAAGAETLYRQALQIDPLSASNWIWLSINLAGQGRLDEAKSAVERNQELRPGQAPGVAQLVFVQVLRGKSEEALALARAMPAGIWHDVALAMAAQGSGDEAEAERTLHILIDRSADGSAYQIAEVFARRGEADKAFEWLDRAWMNRDPGLRRLLTDPFIARYRSDPRFAEFCRKAGLPLPPGAAPADA
jgi:TolB-like protein/Tfp pilus assembly protein PilF